MEMSIEEIFNDMKSRCRIVLNRDNRINLRTQCLVFALDVQARDVVNIAEMFEEYILLGGGKIERGGIRGVALIDEDYVPLTASGKINVEMVETLSWWEEGINHGYIHVVPKTRGEFDGGRTVTYKDRGEDIVCGKEYKLTAFDPDHKGNEEFYAAIAEAKDKFRVAWRTDTELRISGGTVRINPTDPVDGDLESPVVWKVYYTWKQKDAVVQVFDAKSIKSNIFDCKRILKKYNIK